MDWLLFGLGCCRRLRLPSSHQSFSRLQVGCQVTACSVQHASGSGVAGATRVCRKAASFGSFRLTLFSPPISIYHIPMSPLYHGLYPFPCHSR